MNHWAIFEVNDSEAHVVPIEPTIRDSGPPAEIACGHELRRDCPVCLPTLVRYGPLDLSEGDVWSHQQPGWPGANDRFLA